MSSIKAQKLTEYRLASDATYCRISFVDRDGADHSVDFPVACLEQLMLTVPAIMSEALRSIHNDTSLELVHVVKSWKVRSTPGEEVIFTFTTSDDFSMSFALPRVEIEQLADAAAEYELEAFRTAWYFRSANR